MSEEKAVFLNGYDRYLVRVIEYSVPGHLYPENALERHLKEWNPPIWRKCRENKAYWANCVLNELNWQRVGTKNSYQLARVKVLERDTAIWMAKYCSSCRFILKKREGRRFRELRQRLDRKWHLLDAVLVASFRLGDSVGHVSVVQACIFLRVLRLCVVE